MGKSYILFFFFFSGKPNEFLVTYDIPIRFKLMGH